MKVAKFKHVDYGFVSVGTADLEQIDGYVRISEYVDVDFPPRADTSRVHDEIAKLNAQAEKISDRCDTELDAINKKISKLSELLIDGGNN